MPFGYLITTGLVTLFVLFAVVPPRPRRSSRMRLSFWLGFAVNEVPFLAFYVLAASTALALAQGDIATPVGWIGLALAVLAAAGLVVVVLRAIGTGAVVDEALAAAGLPTRTPHRLPLRIFFWPFGWPHLGVERISNISYGDAGRANLLDVYRGGSGRGPTFIHLHGGGFRIGKKSREARPLLHRLARSGWVCISANYRLRTRYPDQLADAKTLLAWVHEHGPEYGADPSIIFLAGSSAGGHLVAMAALTANDASVAAVVSLYGYYGPAGPERSSPMEYLGEAAPPFFVAHPERDTLVIAADARRFVESLRNASVNPVVYAELPGAQHGFDFFYSIRFEAVIDGIEAFAEAIRARRRS